MAQNAKRDSNYVPTLLGVSSLDLIEPTLLAVDPVTNRLLVTSDFSGSLTISISGPSSSSVTSVNDSASSVTLIASNTNRKEVVIQNDSASTLYIKFGTTASTTDYTFKLYTDDGFVTDYRGRIDGIWSADSTGAAKITELT